MRIQKPQRLSASTINSFLSRRPGWVLGKLFGFRGPSNPNFCRGKAVEDGVNLYVETRKTGRNDDDVIEEAIAHARQRYEDHLLKDQVTTGKIDDIRKHIEPFTRKGIDFLVPGWETSGFPSTQSRIEKPVLGRDFICFLDYEEEARVRDLKCVGRKPSKLSLDYQVQGSIYKYVTGKPVIFTHVCPSGVFDIPVTTNEYDFAMGLIGHAIEAIDRIYDLLAESDQAREMCELMGFPDINALWNGEEIRHQLKSYGIKDREQRQRITTSLSATAEVVDATTAPGAKPSLSSQKSAAVEAQPVNPFEAAPPVNPFEQAPPANPFEAPPEPEAKGASASTMFG